MEGNKENFYGEKIVSFAANDQGIKEFEGNKIEVLLYEHGRVNLKGYNKNIIIVFLNLLKEE